MKKITQVLIFAIIGLFIGGCSIYFVYDKRSGENEKQVFNGNDITKTIKNANEEKK